MWELYKRHPGIVLGFHGCDKDLGEAILAGKQGLKNSSNDYDWLGNGIYFWEGSPARALEFAKEATQENQKVSQGRVTAPFVLGAIINLGYCCNLVDSDALGELKRSYDTYQAAQELLKKPLAQNKGKDHDLKARFLDCAVVESMHAIRKLGGLPAYDTVRCPFWEGGELYPGSGFTAQAHIQVAVRSPQSILGYFRPIKQH